MKKVFIAVVAVTMFACSNTETTTTKSCDSTCKDSVCLDSIGVKQLIQMDSLHKEGKL